MPEPQPGQGHAAAVALVEAVHNAQRKLWLVARGLLEEPLLSSVVDLGVLGVGSAAAPSAQQDEGVCPVRLVAGHSWSGWPLTRWSA